MTVVRGFHDGELAVQRQAGVDDAAARLTGMLAAPALTGGAGRFLRDRDLAVLTAHDREGLLWTVPLPGAPGFLAVVDDATLDVLALPAPDGPLGGGRDTGPGGLTRGDQIGLVAVDLAARRRLRVNGTLAALGPTGFAVAVDQAFGNCPQYIQRRQVDVGGGADGAVGGDAGEPAAADGGRARTAEWSDSLGAEQRRLIERADTFFLGTNHPDHGADTSHRGGAPGFVRVEGGGLWWPDYPGNNMFNSLGNIAADGTAALLFVDFPTGTALHLSGTAEVEWTRHGVAGDDGGTGRRVRFTPRRVVTTVTRLRAADPVPYPGNPRLTG
jgi:predicted pyridoxine 5'-phosphate oxidase superfamily flavin-nucleotide-binding protein